MGSSNRDQRLGDVLEALAQTISDRKAELPEGSYTTYLFSKGLDKILKKVGEEASEIIIAAKNEDTGELVGEISDLLYHLLVLMAEREISLQEVADVLSAREGRSADPKYRLGQGS